MKRIRRRESPRREGTMVSTTKELFALTTEDLMNHEVIAVPRRMSLRDAASLFRRADISGAPVVDEKGACVGMLTAADFLRWAADGCPEPAAVPEPVCPYQTKGRLLTGEDAVVCTLAEGSCPLQQTRPATGGRHVAVCQAPPDALTEWQQLKGNELAGTAGRYMTKAVVAVAPTTPLSEVAQRMVDAHIHRMPVLGEGGRPVGIVSSTDLLVAVAQEGMRSSAPPLPRRQAPSGLRSGLKESLTN